MSSSQAEDTRTGGRWALIVASTDYVDPAFGELRAPQADAEALAAVLSDPQIGGFEVRTLLNEPAHVVTEAVEELLTDRSPDDLVLLHFSCHGIKDQGGDLYFAMSNTKLRLLGATAVAADFVNRRMAQSRSRRIVLFLDCCYAGAFDRGMRSRGAQVVDLEERFSGRGRAVITASGAVEYAFEGGELTEAGDPAPSVFTTAMVRGLRTGEADLGKDGYVDLDELYDYVYNAVRDVSSHQTPGKWVYGIEGDLVIARRGQPVTEPSPLPDDLRESLESPLLAVRAGTVDELTRLLQGRHPGLALAARRALEDLTADDSRSVSAAAAAALQAAGSSEETGSPLPLPAATPPVPPSETRPAPATPGRDPVWRRALRAPAHHRRWSIAVLAVLVALLGFAGWRVLGGGGASSTIPSSFDGKWVGTGPTYDTNEATFTVVLDEGLRIAQMSSGASSCYGGALRVTEATDAKLTTRFTSVNPECPKWGVVFTHADGTDDQLVMSVDPDGNTYNPFEIKLDRQN